MTAATHSESLRATGGARQELVLLHGWGGNREVWRPLLAALRPWANVTLLDIPGCAPGAAAPGVSLDDALAAILDAAPARAVYLGFSLGGQLALELARREPGRVLALATLCSSPRFLAGDDWPGMSPQQFDAFRAALASCPGAAARRFDSLQAAGSTRRRALLRALAGQRRAAADASLRSGLDWLYQLDQRDALVGLTQPRLHLFAAADELVPAAVAGALAQRDGGAGQVRTLPGCGHLAPLEQPAAVAAELTGFLTSQGLLDEPPAAPAPIPKASVAASFSRAASAYDSAAHLQREVGNELLARLDGQAVEPRTVLDLGCGTGYFQPALAARFPAARHLGLDLAEGMVEHARRRGSGATGWLVGDAEALPLASASIDLVFSSLALQWCYRLPLLFAEIARVLAPGGKCVFTSLGPGTLSELRRAWAQVDAHQHVNTFLPAPDLEQAARATAGIDLQLEVCEYQLTYARVRDLLGELKAIGAHNMNSDRRAGLAGRRALEGMLRAYERERRDGVLPATYEVYFGVISRQGEAP